MATRTVIRTHGLNGYRAGCRCAVCCSAESVRKRKQGTTGSGAKRSPIPLRRKFIGEAERAVIDECASAPRAQDRPTTVQQARCMARILDIPELNGLHARAASELRSLLNSLHPEPKTKRRASVATLRSVKRQRTIE